MSGADLHATLKAKGYRLTPQRQLVLEAVVNSITAAQWRLGPGRTAAGPR